MKDSHRRSFIKGVSWRALGTLDTMGIAFFITGHIENAIKIGLTEVVTKIILFYFHERLWNMVLWGRTSKGPSHLRSFIKGVTWRITGTIDTIFLSFLITGHIENALKIGATELITKIVLFYFHERIWALVKWGRIKDEIKLKPTVKEELT